VKRLRLMLAGVLVIVAAGVVIAVPGGQPTLADAAERLAGQSIRARVHIVAGDEYESRGTVVASARGERTHASEEVYYPDEDGVLDMRTITVGDRVWYAYEQAEDAMPQGKRWVRGADEESPPSLTMAELATVVAEADDIERVGETTIAGRKAEHYRGTVSYGELGDHTEPAVAERLERRFGDAVVAVEAWLGDDGRLVRMTTRYGRASMRMDVLEYGVPVDVEPPPASQTISQAEFDRLMAD
jgi:hypothetical protein